MRVRVRVKVRSGGEEWGVRNGGEGEGEEWG